MFNLYIKRAAEIFGVTHTREIYEKAIEVLPDEHARFGFKYFQPRQIVAFCWSAASVAVSTFPFSAHLHYP